jgi:hypothetical protein
VIQLFHEKRRFRVERETNAAALAEKLTERTWPLCRGFELLGYLFLNDSTSEDGAQEYAVVKRQGDAFIQVESITFSWCAPERALVLIDDVLHGEFDAEALYGEVKLQGKLDTPEAHGTCPFCR